MRWVLLLLVACRSAPLGSADGELRLAPASLDLGQVYVGYAASAAATVSFSGQASCDVELTASAPFTVTGAVHLARASSAKVTVSLTASAAGALTGTLLAKGCGHSASLSLTAQAVEPPNCGQPGVCTAPRFDPGAGECTSGALPDGTPCTDTCLSGATCRQGQCVGAARVCDDGDPCTLDTCSPTAGCQHLDGVAFCPPLPGCNATCDGGDCGPLTELWTSAPTANWVIEPTVADEQGNVYWLEVDVANGYQGWLASMSHTGAERYRVAVNLINADPQPMLTGGVLTFSGRGVRNVSGFRAADGAFLWKRDLHDDIEQAGHPELEGMFTWVNRGTVGAQGEVLYPVAFWNNSNSTYYWLVALDPATGTTLWRAQLDSDHWQIQADEAGNVYVWVRYSSWDLSAYDAQGGLKWHSSHQPGPSWNGRVYSGDAILDADGGQPLFTFVQSWLPPDVVTPDYGLRREPHSSWLHFFEPLGGQTRAMVPELGEPQWELIATAPDELLGVSRGLKNRVVGFGADGTQHFSCTFEVDADAGTYLYGSSTLVRDMLLVWSQSTAKEYVLHAFALPGRSEAPKGWVSSYGSMARTMKPK